MKLASEFIQLPLRFDAALLAAEVEQFDASAWRPHPQGHPGNFALPLVAAFGDPTNDQTKGPMRPTPHLQRCNYLRQTIAAFRTVVGRTRLMRLEGRAEATRHTDTNYYWQDRARIHVPLTTTPGVYFQCGAREVHMAAGESWIFDTWRSHNVINPEDCSRTHLVIDTVGSPDFWQQVAAGRDPFAVADDRWAARSVEFERNATTAIACETVNHPVVMSPWEIDLLCTRVVGELDAAVTAQFRQQLQAAARRLLLAWRALWAEFGTQAAGWPYYAEVLSEFDVQLQLCAGHGRLRNGIDATEALRQFIVRAALNTELAVPNAHLSSPSDAPPATHSAAATAATPAVSASAPRRVTVDPFAEPIFIVSPPRSGSSLLFETLLQSPDAATIGGESHRLIESIGALDPRQRQFDSNRLYVRDATPEVIAELRQRFAARLHDREGVAMHASDRPLRLLEKTPKNALRIPFLAHAFPGARFVYLYRDARETLSSMLDAWKSGRFATYPQLPDWPGPPWSLLLTPGWREWRELPLAEVVARQWATTVRILLDDLEALADDRWCVASYDRLIAEPQWEIQRLCAHLGLRWDRQLSSPLPDSRHTLSSPAPDKWKHNAAELEPAMHCVAAQANRAHQLFARPPATRRARPDASQSAPSTEPAAGNFASVFSADFPRLLSQLGATLAVTTYQSGRLILVRSDGESCNTHLRAFPNPMGLARRGDRIALGTQRMIWQFANQPQVAARLSPAGKHDACFVPIGSQVTGDIRVHELGFVGDQLWAVNTRFSCLSSIDHQHSFVPRWRPRFISRLAAEDRCHLNGMALHDDQVRYVSALGTSDAPQGWRERKSDGGCVIDVGSGELVTQGLNMPHSPRLHDGRLWILESGIGTLSTIDPANGRVERVAELPGFTRGLAFSGPLAFVGLSQVRESIFAGVPVAEREHDRYCGVWVVDTRNGRILAALRFEGDVREIFDVQLLAGLRYPELLEPDADLTAHSFLVPQQALAENP